MYLSDYFYANNVYYNNPNSYAFNVGSACTDNWLCKLNLGDSEWTMTHESVHESSVYSIFSENFGFDVPDEYIYGANDMSWAEGSCNVRPVLYLKSGIKVTGTGDINSKYQIVS